MLIILALFTPATLSAHGLAPSLQRYHDSEPAVIVEGETLTVGDIKTLIGMRSARYRPFSSLIYDVDDVATHARVAPVYQRIAEEAQSQGRTLSDADLRILEDETNSFVRRLLHRRAVTDTIEAPPFEELRELYEEIRDTRLRTPERFLIRRVSIPYTTEEEAEVAEALLSQMRADFNSGEDIMRLLRARGIVAPTRVIYPNQSSDPELFEALHDAQDEEALAIHRTESEVSFVIRHLYIEPSSVPFSSSFQLLTDIITDREAMRLAAEFHAHIADEPGMLRIVPENLQSRGELALDSDILLLVGDKRVRRDELHDAMGWRLEIAARGDMDDFIDLVLDTGVVQKHMLDEFARRENMGEDPEVIAYRDNLRATLLVRSFLNDEVTGRIAPTSEDEALAHWREGEAILGRHHGRVRFDHFAIPSTDPNIDQWSGELAAAVDMADFHRIAREAVRRRSASTMRTGLQAHVDALPPAVGEVISGGDLPALAVPTRGEGEPLEAYWILEAVPDKRPSSAQLEQSREMVHQQRYQNALEEILFEKAADIPIEVLIRPIY